MKKTILGILVVMSLVMISGCGKVSEKTQQANSIKKFLRENMISEWAYDTNKISIKDDNSVQLKYNHVPDWTSCVYYTNTAILQLANSKDETLKIIPSITFACYDYEGKESGKAEYTNLTEFNEINLMNNSKYYDKSGNLMTDNVEESYKNLCNEYSYSDMTKNISNYVGKKIEFSGKINQVFENESADYVYYSVSLIEKGKVNNNNKFLVFIRRNLHNGKINKDEKFKFYGEIISSSNGYTTYGVDADSPALNIQIFEKIK